MLEQVPIAPGVIAHLVLRPEHKMCCIACKNRMTFNRYLRSNVPAKALSELAGFAGHIIAYTGQALRGSRVESGTSQEPHKPTTGEVFAHTQLSPLEVPSRPPRRLRAKLPTLSRMGATAGWRSQVKNDAPRLQHGAIAAARPLFAIFGPEKQFF